MTTTTTTCMIPTTCARSSSWTKWTIRRNGAPICSSSWSSSSTSSSPIAASGTSIRMERCRPISDRSRCRRRRRRGGKCNHARRSFRSTPVSSCAPHRVDSNAFRRTGRLRSTRRRSCSDRWCRDVPHRGTDAREYSVANSPGTTTTIAVHSRIDRDCANLNRACGERRGKGTERSETVR